MSFFSWFSDKTHQTQASNDETRHAGAGRSKSVAILAQRLASDAARPGEGGKLKRHARREQLYVAIREAMTRGGVLSASYKFKVLSLDQPGNEFLVMLDLGQAFGCAPEQLGVIEALIVQSAKARFEITVPAVYWRLEAVSRPQQLPAEAATGAVLPAPVAAPAPLPARHVKPTDRYQPIRSEEVAAFKLALQQASARGPAGALEKGEKARHGAHSYTLLTGFEDTEMVEPASAPALSNTQYGDLH